MNELSDRVIQARRDAGLSQVELSRRVGVTQQSIQQLENGTVKSPRYVLELAEALNVNPTWLRSGKGDKAPPKSMYPRSELVMGGGFEVWDNKTPYDPEEVDIPLFREVELSAGSGRTEVVENQGAKLKFAKSTLRRASVQAENAACAFVHGNSMEPMIPDGSTIGINKGDTKIRDGKVYAIDHNGMLRVKFLYRQPGGGLRLVSANSHEHPTEDYTPDEFADQIRILGRVFWWSVLDI